MLICCPRNISFFIINVEIFFQDILINRKFKSVLKKQFNAPLLNKLLKKKKVMALNTSVAYIMGLIPLV